MAASEWFGYRTHLEAEPRAALRAMVPRFRRILEGHADIRGPEIAWESQTGTILIQGETRAGTDNEAWEIFEGLVGDLLDSIGHGSGLRSIGNPGAEPYPYRPRAETPLQTVEGAVADLLSIARDDGLTESDECAVEYHLWFRERDAAEQAVLLLRQEEAETQIEAEEDEGWIVRARVRTLARQEDLVLWEDRIRQVAGRLGGQHTGLVFDPHPGAEDIAIARISIMSGEP